MCELLNPSFIPGQKKKRHEFELSSLEKERRKKVQYEIVENIAKRGTKTNFARGENRSFFSPRLRQIRPRTLIGACGKKGAGGAENECAASRASTAVSVAVR